MAFLIGLLLSFLIAFPAFKKKSLSKSGFIASLIVGAILYLSTSYIGFVIMIMFFISSSIFSKLNKNDGFERKIVDKGSTRDYIQVLANALIPLIYALLFLFSQNEIFLIGVIFAFASSTADTWASEVGSNSKQIPKYIFTREPVVVGLSGGVTKLGFLASFLGSAFISLCFIILSLFNKDLHFNYIFVFLIILVIGFIGSLLDSIMGELFQVKYISNVDENRITELPIENSKKNKKISGISWIDNNMVNILSQLLSSILGVVIIYLI